MNFRFKQLILILSLAVVTINFAGMVLHFYDSLPYLDSIVHVLAGFWVALVVFYVFSEYPAVSLPNRGRAISFLVVVSLAALIGILWEFFEFFIYKISLIKGDPITPQTWPDTLQDLFLDIVGASLASLLAVIKRTEN